MHRGTQCVPEGIADTPNEMPSTLLTRRPGSLEDCMLYVYGTAHGSQAVRLTRLQEAAQLKKLFCSYEYCCWVRTYIKTTINCTNFMFFFSRSWRPINRCTKATGPHNVAYQAAPRTRQVGSATIADSPGPRPHLSGLSARWVEVGVVNHTSRAATAVCVGSVLGTNHKNPLPIIMKPAKRLAKSQNLGVMTSSAGSRSHPF